MRLLVLPLVLGACAARDHGVVTAGDIEVRRAFAFSPPTSSEAAAYFTVVNRGASPDTVVSITSPVAESAMLHAQVPDGGMMRMAHLESPVVPARDSLVLEPGGTHLMLVNLDRTPKPGDSISVTLTLARAGAVTVMLPVRAYGDAP